MKNKYDILFRTAETTRQVAVLYFRLYDEIKNNSIELSKLEQAHERAYSRVFQEETNRAELVRKQENAVLFID